MGLDEVDTNSMDRSTIPAQEQRPALAGVVSGFSAGLQTKGSWV